jgi:TPR repeat protein
LYYEGQGVPQDDEEALKWIELAAEQGNSLAQANLEKMQVR